MIQAAKIFILFILIVLSSMTTAQENKLVKVSAIVAPDSGKKSMEVHDLKLDIVFAGYGIYFPSDFKTLTALPLENGETIEFSKIAEATFKGERVKWKKYILPEERDKYENIDSEGYYHWSDIEVRTIIYDWQDEVINTRLKRPDLSDIFLIGQTARGDFKLQLDVENQKTVHIIFNPQYYMQCTHDSSHIYPNATWKFCPECGHKLKKILKANIDN